MGVSGCHYVMIAAKFDYNEFKQAVFSKQDEWDLVEVYCDNLYSKHISTHNGLTMIIDGMCGEYVFFGIVISKDIGRPSPTEIVVCDEALCRLHEVEEMVSKELYELKINLPVHIHIYAFTCWH